MFAGIIEKRAKVVSVGRTRSTQSVSIQKPRGWKLRLGQSINIDGICSTVVAVRTNTFDVEYMPMTLSKTIASLFTKGRLVNLERSLKYGDRIDGHVVQGHVDRSGRVAAASEGKKSRELVVALPPAYSKKILPHGSVALNGVSLTVARKCRATFTVALIPYTLAHTNLGRLRVGDLVNVETDHTLLLAPRVARATVAAHAKKKVSKRLRT